MSDIPPSPDETAAAEEVSSRSRPSRLRRFIVLGLLVLIAAYLIEDWRGSRVWEDAKAQLQAKGEPLSWLDQVPPPVPDEQNVWGSAVLKRWVPARGVPIPAGDTNKPGPGDFPSLPQGYFPLPTIELREVQELPASAADATDGRSREGMAAWLAHWDDEFAELAAASQRPKSRMPGEYSVAISMPIPNFVRARTLAQVLSSRAKLCLAQGRPEVALQSLDGLGAVMKGLDSRPATLVSTMIRVAIAGLYIDVAREGLAAGLWRNQLPGLQERLAHIELIPSIAAALRTGERTAVIQLLDNMAEVNPVTIGLRDRKLNESMSAVYQEVFSMAGILLVPKGWIRQNEARYALLMQGLLDGFSVKDGEVNPERQMVGHKRLEEAVGRRSVYNYIAAIAIPNFLKATSTTARNQALLRMGTLACALERYRADKGVYPERLEGLTPGYIAAVPRDPLMGRPFVYKRQGQPAVRYQLYSLGWDGKDDGGRLEDPSTVNDPDWVWSMDPLTRKPSPGVKR